MSDPRNPVPYLAHLQEANRHAVGWLTKGAISGYVEHGNYRLQRQNGDLCGYLLFGTAHGPRPRRDPLNLRITQVCIQVDARRFDNATRLIRELEIHATIAGYHSLRLWCASDLEANMFWDAMGFCCDDVRMRGPNRKTDRPHRHWTRYLPNHPDFHQLWRPSSVTPLEETNEHTPDPNDPQHSTIFRAIHDKASVSAPADTDGLSSRLRHDDGEDCLDGWKGMGSTHKHHVPLEADHWRSPSSTALPLGGKSTHADASCDHAPTMQAPAAPVVQQLTQHQSHFPEI